MLPRWIQHLRTQPHRTQPHRTHPHCTQPHGAQPHGMWPHGAWRAPAARDDAASRPPRAACADAARHVRAFARVVTIAWTCLAVAWCAGTARAGSDQSTLVDDVTIRVRAPWPDLVTHGAIPLLFDVRNASGERRVVELELASNDWMRGTTVRRGLTLEPGASSSFEVFAPAHTGQASVYRMIARSDAGGTTTLASLGSPMQPDSRVRNVIVVSARTGGDARRWTTLLSDEARPRHADWADARPIAGHFVATSVGSTPVFEGVRASAVSHADLPSRPEGYASLDAVVIDARDGAPRPDAMAAIAEYARTGGTVLWTGAGARAAARASVDFGPWLEDRFRVDSTGGVDTWVCAQGLVMVSDAAEPFGELAEVEQLNAAIEGSHAGMVGGAWIPSGRVDRSQAVPISLPGLQLPYRALMCVLIAFALVIGPLNFWFVRRSRKPALLLVTVPVIAVVFSLGLFAYGVAAQGLDARAATLTFAVLDQRTHRSTAVEVREVFVGMASADGLRPGSGASVWLAPSTDTASRREDVLTFGEGVLLSGGYLPVRTPTKQTILTDRASRLRVDVRREGGAWVVQNGLGATLEQFRVRLLDGEVYGASAPIPAGGRATLSKDAVLEPLDVPDRCLAARPEFVSGDSSLPVGTYAASVERALFGDDLGVAMREVDARHSVFGILDPAELR